MITATTRLDKAIAREILRNVLRTRSSIIYAILCKRGIYRDNQTGVGRERNVESLKRRQKRH